MAINLENLSPDDRKKMREYIMSIKEIKKEIKEMLNKANMNEEGGDMMNRTLNIEEE